MERWLWVEIKDFIWVLEHLYVKPARVMFTSKPVSGEAETEDL